MSKLLTIVFLFVSLSAFSDELKLDFKHLDVERAQDSVIQRFFSSNPDFRLEIRIDVHGEMLTVSSEHLRTIQLGSYETYSSNSLGDRYDLAIDWIEIKDAIKKAREDMAFREIEHANKSFSDINIKDYKTELSFLLHEDGFGGNLLAWDSISIESIDNSSREFKVVSDGGLFFTDPKSDTGTTLKINIVRE